MDIFSKPLRINHQLDLKNPFAVNCKHFPQAISVVRADVHYDMQIGIILAGGMEVAYTDFKTCLSPGQVWWSSCWEPHACRVSCDDTVHLVISFIVDALGNVDSFGRFPWLLPFSLTPSRRPQAATKEMRKNILSLGRAIQKINEERPFAWKTLLWLKIHELIIVLSRDEEELQNQKQVSVNSISRVMPALQLVREDLSAPVLLEKAAAACAMSVSRFCEVFQDIMGITFGKFALRARISGAAQVLKTTNQPIKAIAAEWGFANNSHFYHVFRQHFHCTPAQYRGFSKD